MDVSTVTNSAVFYGFLGAASALVFAGAGAAYGTLKSAKGMAKASKKGNIVSALYLVPVVMSGVLAIYGLMYSVMAAQTTVSNESNILQSYATLCGGLAVGLCSLVSGVGIGIIAESSISTIDTPSNTKSVGIGNEYESKNLLKVNGDTPKLSIDIPNSKNTNNRGFSRMCVNLIYCEAVGLYGLIFGLIVLTSF